MEKPVFILGSHKSGTSLLRNLLDGVSGFFVVPFEAHFFEYAGLWVDYAIRRSLPVECTFEEFLGRVEAAVRQSSRKTSTLKKFGGGSVDAEQWNVDALMARLSATGRAPFERKDYRGMMDAYIEAIYLALNGELPSPAERFVEKSVENAEFASLLKKMYPDAKFIHIVRNPYAALVSTRKFILLRGKYPYLGTLLDGLENSYYHAFNNPAFIEDYLVLRYEDLLLEPEARMRQVATFLDIPFEGAMLAPTSLGKEWQGNSMSGKSFNGVSTTPLTAWKNEIHPLETALVNLLLPHVLAKFDYEKIQPSSSLYLPVKGEGLRKYIANRFFWLSAQIRRTGQDRA